MSIGRNRPPEPDGKYLSYWGIFEAVADGLIVQDAKTQCVVEVNPAAAAMHGYSREEFIGLYPVAYIHPDSHIFSEAAQVLQPDGVLEAPSIHIHKNGSPFYVEVRKTEFSYQSRPCLLSIVRDISKRVEAEQLLYTQAEVRQREQSTLLDISHILASTLELKPDLILDQLRIIVPYSHATLFVLKDSALVAVALRGMQQAKDAEPFSIQLNSPEMLARLFNQHRPIRIADLSNPDEQAQFIHALYDSQAAMLLEGVGAWMWVPLAVKGRIIGGMGVAHTQGDYFTEHDANLALTVANQAAITMINAELYQNAQALAVLQERQRLAQNLHDAVNQSLFSAGLIAEVLPRLWERDRDLARQSLEDLRRLTRGAMAEMRALLAELRPSTLTDADLGELLGLLGNAFTGRTNIPITVTAKGKGTLSAEVQVAIYRICQEALNNIAKHAGANTVEINLEHQDGAIELSIRDDGRGFDTKKTVSGHYGLGMIQERAQAVRAHVTITSQPGHGTLLTIRWPKTPAQEAL